MTVADWVQVGLTVAAIILSVAGSAFAAMKYLSASVTKQAVANSQLTTAVNNLTETVKDMTKAIKHMDDRIDVHDIEIALLKEKQKA